MCTADDAIQQQMINMKEEMARSTKNFLLFDLKMLQYCPKCIKFHEFSITSLSYFMGGPPTFYGGASTILLGGPLGILSWQARAWTYTPDILGGGNVRFGATWAAGPPRPPILGNPEYMSPVTRSFI